LGCGSSIKVIVTIRAKRCRKLEAAKTMEATAVIDEWEGAIRAVDTLEEEVVAGDTEATDRTHKERVTKTANAELSTRIR
jgi:hypothetical protein